MLLDSSRESVGEFQKRLLICLLIIVSFFGIVLARLFYLQVIKGKYFWFFSAEHAIKEIRIPATRGIIFDGNRIPLAENRPSFDLAIVPQDIRSKERVKESFGKIAGVDPDLFE